MPVASCQLPVERVESWWNVGSCSPCHLVRPPGNKDGMFLCYLHNFTTSGTSPSCRSFCLLHLSNLCHNTRCPPGGSKNTFIRSPSLTCLTSTWWQSLQTRRRRRERDPKKLSDHPSYPQRWSRRECPITKIGLCTTNYKVCTNYNTKDTSRHKLRCVLSTDAPFDVTMSPWQGTMHANSPSCSTFARSASRRAEPTMSSR